MVPYMSIDAVEYNAVLPTIPIHNQGYKCIMSFGVNPSCTDSQRHETGKSDKTLIKGPNRSDNSIAIGQIPGILPGHQNLIKICAF